jgi:hypothetical protein
MGLGGTNVSPPHIEKAFHFVKKIKDPPLSPIFDLEDKDGGGMG